MIDAGEMRIMATDRGGFSADVRSGCSTLWDGYVAIASNGCIVVTTQPTLPSGVGGGDDPVVLVIDDDMAMRESLSSLFQSVGLRVKVFGSAPELLQVRLPNAPSCLVLDIRLPGISGLDFEAERANSGFHIRSFFITAQGI